MMAVFTWRLKAFLFFNKAPCLHVKMVCTTSSRWYKKLKKLQHISTSNWKLSFCVLRIIQKDWFASMSLPEKNSLLHFCTAPQYLLYSVVCCSALLSCIEVPLLMNRITIYFALPGVVVTLMAQGTLLKQPVVHRPQEGICYTCPASKWQESH